MNIEHRLYPYPVLSYFSDDYINSSFTSSLNIIRRNESIIFELDAKTDNEGLLKLIEEGFAEYIFHIECPSTSYRNIITSSNGSKTVVINESLLNNKVNVCFFIVAKKDIGNFVNKDFNSDYENLSFYVEKANILAIARQFNINIEKEKDNLAQVPSIFLIIKRGDNERKRIEIDMLQEKIEISLSKDDYENYLIFSSGNYQSLLHSSIIFPSLVYVFENLKTIDMETIEDLRWFKTIKKVLSNLNIEMDKESLDSMVSYDVAQKIINYPVNRSLFALLSLNNGEEEDE